jgi:hypothetical protein
MYTQLKNSNIPMDDKENEFKDNNPNGVSLDDDEDGAN